MIATRGPQLEAVKQAAATNREAGDWVTSPPSPFEEIPGLKAFDPRERRDDRGRWTESPELRDFAAIRNVLGDMGAFDMEVDPEHRPDLFMKHPKSGFTVRNDKPAPTIVTKLPEQYGQGEFPMVADTVPVDFPKPDDVAHLTAHGFQKEVPGTRRPLPFAFRAISEEDYQQSLKRGYMQSDQRMNLSQDEGTVAEVGDPSFYLPGKLSSDADGEYPGRIVKIALRPEDGWTYDRDGYIKTRKPIPVEQLAAVSPVIVTDRRDGRTHTHLKAFDPHERRDARGRWTDGSSVPEWIAQGDALYEHDLEREWPNAKELRGITLNRLDTDEQRKVAREWNTPEFVSATNFESPDLYDDIQTAARMPDKLLDHVSEKYVRNRQSVEFADGNFEDVGGAFLPGGPRMKEAAAEFQRQARWLDHAIDVHGEPPPVDTLYRVTGMDHLPKEMRAKLKRGETVFVKEPGFFSTTPSQSFARQIANMTAHGPQAMWRVTNPKGAKAVNLDPLIQVSRANNPLARLLGGPEDPIRREFIFGRNNRMAIKLVTDGTAIPIYDVTLLGSDS